MPAAAARERSGRSAAGSTQPCIERFALRCQSRSIGASRARSSARDFGVVHELAEDGAVKVLADDAPVEGVDVEPNLVGELLLLDRLRGPVDERERRSLVELDGFSRRRGGYCLWPR